jgi:hypothetical protein
LFNSVFEQAEKIPYDSSWENGTGYFDGAVNYQLEVGKVAATVDPNNRSILLIGTRWGSVVIFYRYENNTGPVVKNYPKSRKLRDLAQQENEYLEYLDLVFMLGNGKRKLTERKHYYSEMNIGEKLEYMFKE